MKKNIIISFLLIFVSLILFGCESGQNKNEETDFKVDVDSLEVEVGHAKILNIENYIPGEMFFKVENEEVASFTIADNALVVAVEGENVGNTNLNVIYHDEIIKTIKIKVIEEVIFLPIPTGKILLKGVDKEASVKIILTKDGLDFNSATWEIDNSDVVSMEYQGGIAHFHSLARGKATVTVRVGDYENSFEIYVTNIRGDID